MASRSVDIHFWRPRRVGAAICVAALLSGSCDDRPTEPSPVAPVSLAVVLVPVDSGYQATAVAAFSNSTSRDVTAEAQWSSSNPNVAVVTSSGRVTPVAPGATDIRATYQGISGGAALTIEPSPVAPPPAAQERRVSGTVRDALDETPLPNVVVTVRPQGQASGQTSRTDSHGAYSISGPFEGTVIVAAQIDGYDGQTVERSVAGDTAIDFSLRPRPLTLSGNIVDARDDDPIACEPVRIEVLDGPNAGRFTLLWRDSSGSMPKRYEIRDLQPGTATFRVSAPQHGSPQYSARLRGIAPFNELNMKLCRAPSCSDSRTMCGTIDIGGATKAIVFLRPDGNRLTFRATGGQAVTVRLTNNTYGTIDVKLLRPDLSTITSVTSGDTAFNLSASSLPTTGRYTILLVLIRSVLPPLGAIPTLSVNVTSP